MKAQITITWNPETGDETKVTFSDAWHNLSSLERLDNLKDATWELSQKYKEINESEGVLGKVANG